MSYTDEQIGASGVAESSLSLLFWEGNTWVDALPCTGCSVDTINNRATMFMNHFTEFALVGDVAEDKTRGVYLLLIER